MAAKKKDNVIVAVSKNLLGNGDLLRSKKFRAFATGLVAHGLTVLSMKYAWIDPGYADKLTEYIFWGVMSFMGFQGGTDMLSGGKTSANFQK